MLGATTAVIYYNDIWWSNNCQYADRSIYAAPVKFQNPNKGPENNNIWKKVQKNPIELTLETR